MRKHATEARIMTLIYQLLANLGYRLAEWAERRLDPVLVPSLHRLLARGPVPQRR